MSKALEDKKIAGSNPEKAKTHSIFKNDEKFWLNMIFQ
jgi:hypothetical protein